MSETPNQEHHQEGRRVRKNTAQSKPRPQNHVLTYLAILFAAAFFLLLMAYFMQQRANREAIDGLTQSVTSIHSLQNLVEANEALEEENEALKSEAARLRDSLALLQKESEALREQAEAVEQAKQAMDWFWQVDEAFVLGRYSKCRTLMASMEELDLVKYLPAESVTDNGRFSPADRYQEIYDKLH